ncbi:hypothetical protein [Streptomyces sp. ST2-7A]|uniref:hypothetical protein n=1 Tax=Streptomyces sp. ST2-7A TaxID=2907214 RepID=UPI001F202DFC|nr:hypothetical protein [Streptomyces sp. ST2-7A]MCE7081591.1 hypothetical protein [Streptomyces sp. ST2-7A]
MFHRIETLVSRTARWHHPHFIAAEPTREGGIDFEFGPFDGTEPEPVRPDTRVPGNNIPGPDDHEFLRLMYERAHREWQDARDATEAFEPETRARYLTLAGQHLADRSLTTDVIDRGTEWEPHPYTWECQGCPGPGEGAQYLADAERSAAAHAAACRGIPVA